MSPVTAPKVGIPWSKSLLWPERVDFPSLKAQKLLALLMREPLGYEIARQKGSHRAMRSRNGYGPIGFPFHDGVTVPRRAVRKILIDQAGLSEEDAYTLVTKGKLK